MEIIMVKKDCKPTNDSKKCLPKATTKPPEYATFEQPLRDKRRKDICQ